MNAFSYDTIVDQLIANQRHAIRYRILFALIIAGLGVTIIIVSLLFSGRLIEEGLKTLLGLGGGFVSSLSAFQIGGIIKRREKVGAFQAIKTSLQLLKATGTQDQQGIEHIAADHVSQYQVTFPTDTGKHIHHQFRRRGTEGHDGQPDDDFRDFQAFRQ